MGRILSSRIPRLGNGVNKNIDVSVLKEREMANRMRQKVQFDNRHKAIEAKVLERGEEVWVKDLNRKETVVDKLGDRDYRVTSGIRRNNIHLNHLPINNDITNEIPSPITSTFCPRKPEVISVENPTEVTNTLKNTEPTAVNLETNNESIPLRRSTRTIRKPDRYM